MKESLKKFIRQKVLQPILTQLKQGISPSKLALSVALGVVITLFPIFGTTVTLCIIFSFILKLNLPIVLAINYLMTPAQLLAIPIFIRLGESLFKLPSVSFNPKTIVQEFWASPLVFIGVFGKSALAATCVWVIAFAPLTWIIYKISLPLAKRFIKRKGV